jgi:hypothetical protein
VDRLARETGHLGAGRCRAASRSDSFAPRSATEEAVISITVDSSLFSPLVGPPAITKMEKRASEPGADRCMVPGRDPISAESFESPGRSWWRRWFAVPARPQTDLALGRGHI